MAKEQANLVSVSNARESPTAPWTPRYTASTATSATGVASPAPAMSTSAPPNQRIGVRTRSESRPATKLPSASPAMNEASTVLAAWTVTPNTSPSSRSQSVW